MRSGDCITCFDFSEVESDVHVRDQATVQHVLISVRLKVMYMYEIGRLYNMFDFSEVEGHVHVRGRATVQHV